MWHYLVLIVSFPLKFFKWMLSNQRHAPEKWMRNLNFQTFWTYLQLPDRKSGSRALYYTTKSLLLFFVSVLGHGLIASFFAVVLYAGLLFLTVFGLPTEATRIEVFLAIFFAMFIRRYVMTRSQLDMFTQHDLMPVRASTLRGQFNHLAIVTQKVDKSKSHPNLAASRNGAVKTAHMFCHQNGLQPFIWQMSSADQKRTELPGRLEYYWVSDFNAWQSFDSVPENPLHVLVDVDYHINMPRFLSTHHGPVLLYTIQPRKAAETTEEYCYRISGDEMLMTVAGGMNEIKHKLWDYSNDTITVHGLMNTTVYTVDRKLAQDGLHQYILLAPLRRIWWPTWIWQKGLTTHNFRVTGKPKLSPKGEKIEESQTCVIHSC
jgi:hypothetical protein